MQLVLLHRVGGYFIQYDKLNKCPSVQNRWYVSARLSGMLPFFQLPFGTSPCRRAVSSLAACNDAGVLPLALVLMVANRFIFPNLCG